MKLTHLIVGVVLSATLTACSEKEPEPPKRQRPSVSEIKGKELVRIRLPAYGDEFEYGFELGDDIEYVYVDLEVENADEDYKGNVDLSVLYINGKSRPRLCEMKQSLSKWMTSNYWPQHYVHFVDHLGQYEIKGTSQYETGGNVYLVIKDITAHVKEYDANAVTSVEEAVSVLGEAVRDPGEEDNAFAYINRYLHQCPDPFNASFELFSKFFNPSVDIRSNDFIDDQYAVLKYNFYSNELSGEGGTMAGGIIINSTNYVVAFGGDTPPPIALSRCLNSAGENTIQAYWTLEGLESDKDDAQQVSTRSWYGEPVTIPEGKRLIFRRQGPYNRTWYRNF